jgi:hypothetical protein
VTAVHVPRTGLRPLDPADAAIANMANSATPSDHRRIDRAYAPPCGRATES